MDTMVEEKEEGSRIEARAVTLADIMTDGAVMVDRLREFWPNASAAFFTSRLREWVNDNAAHFVRTRRAFGLVGRRARFVTGSPEAICVFVLFLERPATLGEMEKELRALALAMEKWAARSRCAEVRYDPFDIDMADGNVFNGLRGEKRTICFRGAK